MSAVDGLLSRYLDAQLGGLRREALRLLMEEGLEKGLSVGELSREVVQKAQEQIGRLWQEDRISIAQEHMATAISQLALAYLYQHADAAPPNGKKVLVACVEGELHDFPARLLSDALEMAGFEVRFLGASVPLEPLVATVLTEKPDLVALSVTMAFHIPSLRAAVSRLRAAVKVPIAIGGHACSWASSLATEVGADASGADADALVAAARRLLEVGQ